MSFSQEVMGYDPRLSNTFIWRSGMNSTQHSSSILQCVSREMTERDEELLLAARAGSHAAFGELQNIYAGRLYKRIVSITKNHKDAEDALQDTFFRAYRALPTFEGRSRLSSWLTRIAINSALMILRKRRIQPELAFELQSRIGDGGSFDIRDQALNPEELCDQRERSRAIMHAIQCLKPKMRRAIDGWVWQERSINEIAEDIGVSSASVKSRLHRARKRLSQSPAIRNLRWK